VQIQLDLQTNSDRLALVSLGLRAVDPKKPVLTAVSFIPAKNQHRGELRIAIPDTQPAGIYSGVIVDRLTAQTRGTLKVQVDKD
jgi:hypothetical protein